ncbi:MAG: hypothetical protein AAF617_05620 [Bacteroidota bacterium]
MKTHDQKVKSKHSQSVADALIQQKEAKQTPLQLKDNRPAAVTQLKMLAQPHHSLQRNTLESSEVVQRVTIIDGIEVNPSAGMPTWEQGGHRYHINTSTETYHITREGNPKIHYFYKGAGEEIQDTQPTKAERGGKSKRKVKGQPGKVKTKTVFSALPKSVQTFIKGNYIAILSAT